MMTDHARALCSFKRNLLWLLALRLSVHMATVWFFLWGVVALALKFFGAQNFFWFTASSFLGILPVVFLAVWLSFRRLPAIAKIRASYDQSNLLGGVIMAEEAGDMAAWQEKFSMAATPKLRWNSGRPILLLFIAVAFAATAVLIPEKISNLVRRPSLQIGQIVEQLQAEVKTLKQEKILDDKKSNDLQQQLAALQKDSSGYDPNKTWEALDHIKQADSDAAKTAAEEAIKKTESLTEAETLAKAMNQAAEQGMDNATASQAAQDLASLLNSAKLEDGILSGQIPPELLQNLAGTNGLNAEQMQQLLKALEANKNALNSTMTNLANMKLIDPATLAKLQNSSHTPDYAGLAMYLSQCQGGNCNSEVLFSWLHKRGRGGPGGGGPEAPMDWDNDTSEANIKFQQHTLPPSSHIEDAQMVGVSKSAPELAKDDVAAQHGALDNTLAGGGSGHAQVILPEHRQAVQNFFKRDEK